jgi:hypothetical protein
MLPSKEPGANGWQEAVPLSLSPVKGTLDDVACPECGDQLITVEEITDTVQYEGYSAAGRALLKCPRCQTFYVVNWQSIYSVGLLYY